MSLKSLGQNSAEEFFETLIYLTAYEEARDIIKNLTKDIDNPVLKEALEDSLNVLAFGLIFYLIRMEENFIEKVFSVAGSLVSVLIGSVGRFKKRFRGRGIKGILNFLFSRYSDDNKLKMADIVINQTSNLINARQSVYSSNTLYKSYTDTKDNIYTREKLHLDFAHSYSSQYINSLLFKLFTKSFNKNDELLLKKILGRENVSNLSIDDINKVADFIYVKDDNGNVIGLTDAFIKLLNGLGYLYR